MLSELRVSQLGVIEDLSLVLGPGMTAMTGETGAGKTLVVEAVELLLGGRADAVLVRPGAAEAVVEGRFVFGPVPDACASGAVPEAAAEGELSGEVMGELEGEGEVVLSRVVPSDGRSRAYVDGRMATAGALAELSGRLVDLHGQHAHQSLLNAAAQREALDAYAGADRERRDVAREHVRSLERAIASAGGAGQVREREVELLQYQLGELDAVKLTTANEDDELAEEEESLARASEHRAAAAAAHEALAGEEQVADRLGEVVARLAGRPPLATLHARVRGLAAELADTADEARVLAESLEDDPERLAEVTARRALLHELRRKYGGRPPRGEGGRAAEGTGEAAGGKAGTMPGSLAAVFEWQEAARERLRELEELAGAAERLAGESVTARQELRRASAELGEERRAAAGRLGRAVEAELRRLAMPRARFEVRVVDGEVAENPSAPSQSSSPFEDTSWADLRELAGEDVAFVLAANPGEPLLPLSKVASGGELARAMLALRLALLDGGVKSGERSEGPASPPRPVRDARKAGQTVRSGRAARTGPETLVFDEVDAGIGGEAALAVGKALAELGRRYQVVVVTHLAQVAAFAGAQVAVTKSERAGRTVATAAAISGEERVVELSRMLSGQPGSKTARMHAEELLRMAADGTYSAPPAKSRGRARARSSGPTR